MLAGCGTAPPATQLFNVPVYTPCVKAADVPARPVYEFGSERMEDTPGGRVLALARDWPVGRKYEGQLEALLAGCLQAESTTGAPISGPSAPVFSAWLTGNQSNSSTSSIAVRARCSAFSTVSAGASHRRASSALTATGSRSCTSTMPPSESAVTSTKPASSRFSTNGPKFASASRNSGSRSFLWMCQGCFDPFSPVHSYPPLAQTMPRPARSGFQ